MGQWARHTARAPCRELLAEGYQRRTVKEEIRDNLLARLRTGETAFPGIVGFDDTVLPAARERAARRATTSCCSASAARARPG